MSTRTALLTGLLCALGLVLTWVLAELVPATHVRDGVALGEFTRLAHPGVEGPAGAVLLLLEPPLYAIWAALIAAVALRRYGSLTALGTGLMLILSPLSAELLKPLLAHRHAHLGYSYVSPASWPSGHATAAVTLVWCALFVSPRRLRGVLALLGCLFALAVGCSLLILAWHMPSDVLGGYLLATLWAAFAYAALGGAGPAPWAPGSHSDSAPSLAARARMKSMSESRFR